MSAAGQDALSDGFAREMERRLSERVSAKRAAHVRGVAQVAERLARVYGVDERKARLAGILHDWDKGYDDDGIRARADELGLSVDPFVYRELPAVLHGPTAAAALSREEPGIPADVLRAVECHTAGATDMSPLDMVLYVADAIEPGRRFGEVEKLRQAVGSVSLEELFFRTLRYWTMLLLERGKPMHPDTVEVWNAYVVRRTAGKER